MDVDCSLFRISIKNAKKKRYTKLRSAFKHVLTSETQIHN